MRQFFERFFFAVHVVIALCGLGMSLVASQDSHLGFLGAVLGLTIAAFTGNELIRWVCLGARKPDA